MATNKHIGSTFDSFLKEEGIFEEVTRMARAKIARLKALWDYARAYEEQVGMD